MTWASSQIPVASDCHCRERVGFECGLPCTTIEVDVPWSSRDGVSRTHCVPGLPSQKPREQQRGVLRPAVLQAPQPKVLSHTGKGPPSHSLKYRGERFLWASSVLGSPSRGIECCPPLLPAVLCHPCRAVSKPPGAHWVLVLSFRVLVLRINQINKAIAHLKILALFCPDLGASRMAQHVRLIAVLSWFSWTFVTRHLSVLPVYSCIHSVARDSQAWGSRHAPLCQLPSGFVSVRMHRRAFLRLHKTCLC